ncbi:hypothetical protein FGIG_01791 [Fasciola gigantica]|uniref:Uncharacterized protein n=1 Tax=Fasciola gigantica TaxID=46835 RepID=A0A504YTD2_FASGI|nr:hypothetical protein FGIG_01791 [Fasciola gigantica]
MNPDYACFPISHVLLLRLSLVELIDISDPVPYSYCSLEFHDLFQTHGADVNATDNYGLTAWSYAHVCHQIACTRLLHMNGCHTVSPLGVPADWLQLMRIPFPLSMQTNLLTCTNLSLDVSASSPRAGFQSSDSGSHSCSSSTSSSPAASESDADESRPLEDAAVRPPVV